MAKRKDKKPANFKLNLGDKVKCKITGFEGVVITRSQWLHNCNTYSVKSQSLNDGAPIDSQYFDEPALELIEEKIMETSRETGGPEKPIKQTNRF